MQPQQLNNALYSWCLCPFLSLHRAAETQLNSFNPPAHPRTRILRSAGGAGASTVRRQLKPTSRDVMLMSGHVMQRELKAKHHLAPSALRFCARACWSHSLLIAERDKECG